MSSLSLYSLVLNILDGEKLLELLPNKFISKQLLRNLQSQNTTYYVYNSNPVSIQIMIIYFLCTTFSFSFIILKINYRCYNCNLRNKNVKIDIVGDLLSTLFEDKCQKHVIFFQLVILLWFSKGQ